MTFLDLPEEAADVFLARLSAEGETIERLAARIRVPELVLRRLADGYTEMRVKDWVRLEAWLLGRGGRAA